MLLAKPLGNRIVLLFHVLQRGAGICTQTERTMEAEAFSPYSSMMLLVSLPSISSGTDTFTALASIAVDGQQVSISRARKTESIALMIASVHAWNVARSPVLA